VTADPATVIAAALDERSKRKHGPRGQIDDIIRAAHADIGKAAVAALEAAGWAVVPVAERREEWGIRFTADGRSWVDRYDDREDAERWRSNYTNAVEVVCRTVQTSLWKAPVND
jgi:hypothetical protein